MTRMTKPRSKALSPYGAFCGQKIPYSLGENPGGYFFCAGGADSPHGFGVRLERCCQPAGYCLRSVGWENGCFCSLF